MKKLSSEISDDRIQILLATYNGEIYLEEQLESIISQSFQNWEILVHDDGSSDATVAILKAYVKKWPNKITFLDDKVRCGGAKENFNYLLSQSTANYIAFCDQDDIWLSDRLESGYRSIKKTEAIKGCSHPIIFCSDTTIVDCDLNIIADSGWIAQRVGPNLSSSAGELAVRNYLTGCTMLINRAAVIESVPIPTQAVMHDWWVGICVLRVGGDIVSTDKSTVFYRQHSKNLMGANFFSYSNYYRKLKNIRYTTKEFYHVYNMAKHSGAVGNWIEFLSLKVIVFIKMWVLSAR